MGFFKNAIATAGLTLALAGADYAWGNQSLVEMYNLNAHAPPNGSPITAFVSRNYDNAGRLSIFGWGALLTPPCAAAGGIIAYAGRKSEKKKEKK
ncbi:MAG: hypothetical protein QME12_05350 [Nanoarchaeota archaeon]|nr:hypothetical protein [Nanoarchaeota archaeon]